MSIQTSLFIETEALGLTIDAAANKVGVSTATIRNWVKTGYLDSDKKGIITKKSLHKFVDEVVGKEKLTARANKLQKKPLNPETNFYFPENLDSETLGEVYENSLSESQRNKEGIYYTPPHIVADMFSEEIEGVENKLFLDPCCGGGNFIIRALELGFRPENIYGFDTDNNAVIISQKRIFEKTGFVSNNIIQGDFLENAIRHKQKFDYIFTNPPWGKKITKEQKEGYARIFKAGKSFDTSSLFFFASLSCLAQNGKLGFLLQDAFFNISTFQDARKTALSLNIERLIDYNRPFKGLLTKAQAIILSKQPVCKENIICQTETDTFERSFQSFLSNPKSIINFSTNNHSAKVIDHILNTEYTTLEGNATWGLGIVTGNNEKYCQKEPKAAYIPVFKGSDIGQNQLKPASTFIPDNLDLYQQVAPKNLYEAPEKIIYKFISSNLCFYADTEQCYLLNSANFLILNKTFPINIHQLTDLMNSNLMNWLFQQIYKTHKVLRGDLETLPIHTKYFEQYPIFDEVNYLDFLNIEKNDNGTYRIKR